MIRGGARIGAIVGVRMEDSGGGLFVVAAAVDGVAVSGGPVAAAFGASVAVRSGASLPVCTHAGAEDESVERAALLRLRHTLSIGVERGFCKVYNSG